MAGNFVSALSAGQPVAVKEKGHTEKKFRKARYSMPVVAVDCYSQPACEGGSWFGLREAKFPGRIRSGVKPRKLSSVIVCLQLFFLPFFRRPRAVGSDVEWDPS